MIQKFAEVLTNNMTYTTYGSDPSTANAGAILLLYAIMLIFAIPLVIIPMWMLFKRAGKPGWASIIPVYSTWVLFEITGFTPWWALLSLIPFVSLFPAVVSIMAIIRLAKMFGKGTGFGVLTVFFPFICLPILAYGKAPFLGASALSGSVPTPQAGMPTVAAPQNPDGSVPQEPVMTSQPAQPTDNSQNQPPQPPVA